jgi:hypothetical protein
VALAALLALPALCAAQADAPVPRPEVKVGDRWSYQRVDYDTGRVFGKYVLEVAFAGRGVIHVVKTRARKLEEGDNTFTADWNAVSTDGRVFNPHSGLLRFPLRIGDSYSTTFDAAILKKQGSARNERQVKVIGWEEVTVPAGKFRALKIVAEGHFQRLDTRSSGNARNVIWYVPEVRRWVKMVGESRPLGRGGAGEHTGEELLDYKLK